MEPVGFPSLAQLADVDDVAPADGETLVYNAKSGLWEPATPAGTSGTPILHANLTNPTLPSGVSLTFPFYAELNLAYGFLQIPFIVPGVGGVVISDTSVAVPDFTATVTQNVHCEVWITDLTADNTLSLSVNLGSIPPGDYAGGTFGIDFDDHPPTIVGTDLVAAASQVSSTAGGIAYSGIVSYQLIAD